MDVKGEGEGVRPKHPMDVTWYQIDFTMPPKRDENNKDLEVVQDMYTVTFHTNLEHESWMSLENSTCHQTGLKLLFSFF